MSPHNNIQKSETHQHNTHNLSEEQLMAYSEGKLSSEENRWIEEIISEDGPEADAIEGLQLLQAAATKRSLTELQRKLHTELLRHKPKRKDKLSGDFWNWIAIVTILLLILVGYWVVHIASK
jgi:hypothetical protein